MTSKHVKLQILNPANLCCLKNIYSGNKNQKTAKNNQILWSFYKGVL